MRVKTILFLFCLLNCFITSAQSTLPSMEWQRSFGGTSVDQPSSVIQTRDKGFLLLGNTSSNDVDVSGNHGNQDVWIVKLNSTGELSWKRCYGGSGNDEGFGVDTTSDGGYIFAAYTNSNNGDITGAHGLPDFWVVKINSVGDIVWEKCLGGSDIDYPGFSDGSLKSTSDGGCIAVGLGHSNDGNVVHQDGGGGAWVIKLNSSGTIEWEKNFPNWKFAYAVTTTLDEGYAIVGEVEATNDNPSPTIPMYHTDLGVVKLDKNGNKLWEKIFGGSQNDAGYCIDQSSEGSFFVAGYARSDDKDLSDRPSPNNLTDAWLIKLNSIGDLIWKNTYGGTQEDRITSIQCTQDGGVISGGTSNSNDGDLTSNYGSLDLWPFKVDADGNIEWQLVAGGADLDQLNSIIYTEDQNYLFTGSAKSTDHDVSNNIGSSDFWLVKLSNPTALSKTRIEEPMLVSNVISSSRNTPLVLKGVQAGTTVEIYNSVGVVVYQSENYQNQNGWKGEKCAQGLYVYLIRTSEGNVYNGKIYLMD